MGVYVYSYAAVVEGRVRLLFSSLRWFSFLPFLLFPDSRPVPKLITYLGRTLPAAMMGLLVVYCLRNVSIAAAPHGLPELISIAALTALHLWKRNVLLSIGVGTALYMLLIQVVFV